MNIKSIKTVCKTWLILFTVIALIISFCLWRIRPVVIEYATSCAEGALQSVCNNAIIKVLEQENITYDMISHITRDGNNNFKGIEIDTKFANTLKAKITNEIAAFTADDLIQKVGIPLGTLFFGDFLYGLGPKIYFKTQFYEGVTIDFVNKFVSCGINQVLHQIDLKINLTGNIVAVGKQKGFSLNTTFVLAQTVIVGAVPQSFADISGKF